MNARLDPVREAQAAAALRESLAAVAADDEALLLDTVEGETGLFEAIDALLARMKTNQGFAEGLDKIIAEFEQRAARFRKRVETDRALIEQALMIAELPKLERPGGTLSLTNRAPKVEVQTEADIPAEFWKPAEPRLDKKALAAALKDGRAIPGACLSNAAPTLTIRTV